MTQLNDDLNDDLKAEFEDVDEELWGEWTENPDEEEGSEPLDERNADDFYAKDDEE